jgi:hypothetical protein
MGWDGVLLCIYVCGREGCVATSVEQKQRGKAEEKRQREKGGGGKTDNKSNEKKAERKSRE